MKSLLIPLLFLLSFSAFAQPGIDWTLHTEKDGLQFFYKAVNGDNGNQYLAIKIHNTTTKNLTAEWDFHIWHGDKCRSCGLKGSSFYHKKYVVDSGKSKEIIYSGENKIYYKSGDFAISKFELANLLITKAKKNDYKQ